MYNLQQYWHEIHKLGLWKVNHIPNEAKLENGGVALMAVWLQYCENFAKCFSGNYPFI